MTIMLDIDRVTIPVFSDIHHSRSGEHLKASITDLTLIIEGFKAHITGLSKEEAKKLLDKVKETTRKLVDAEERVKSNSELAQAFDYLIKALSSLRSSLHIFHASDIPVNKTEQQLKIALSNVSRLSVLNSLSKKQ